MYFFFLLQAKKRLNAIDNNIVKIYGKYTYTYYYY